MSRLSRLVAGSTATLLTALLLGVAPGAAHGTEPRPTTARTPAVGAQFHGMWSSYTDEQRAVALDSLRDAGATWVRIDVSWAMLQPKGPDHYSTWGVEFVDRVVTMATSRGLKPLVTLWMTPAWANGGAGARTLPTNPDDYARVARWAAERWRGKVAAWEVWNEPNLDDFMTGADPAAYARLLRPAYRALHEGDPGTKVVMAGTAYNDDVWLARAYAAGVKDHFDVLATHPYQAVADLAPETPDDGTIWRLRHAPAVRALMVRQGDAHKEMWFTEFGWSSHPNAAGTPNWQRGVTEAQQADYLVRTLELVAEEMPYVTNVFWYAERDRVDSHIQNNNYGLMRHDLTPKPALAALRSYLRPTVTAPSGGSLTAPLPTAPTTAPTTAPASAPTTGPATSTTGDGTARRTVRRTTARMATQQRSRCRLSRTTTWSAAAAPRAACAR